jgi:predicted TIM-barrel fold metal-dependent hydrolase
MMLKTPLSALNDNEGIEVPSHFPLIVDSHVHIFPEAIFKSLWKWFDEYGWPIRYKLSSSAVLEFLFSRGVGHVVALQYAHKPGIAFELNQYMAKQCKQFSQKVTGMATVFPGEDGMGDILKTAFGSGLKGVKLHAHVQCFDMNSEEMDRIYDLCSSQEKPIVMHVGREPKSPGYSCDPHLICSAEKLERVIKNYPQLKVCVPHLGTDELWSYKQLIEKYDNLWLDSAMALTDYLPNHKPFPLHEMRVDRIMYGSDFPNIPFAWDRELKWIHEARLPDKSLELMIGKNAIDFFSIPIS